MNEEILDYFPEYYGVRIAFVGEDGVIMALGHPEPKRFVAAAMRMARKNHGLDIDDTFWLSTDFDKELHYGYAEFSPQDEWGFWCKMTDDETQQKVVTYGWL